MSLSAKSKELRRFAIGGSEIACLAGFSRYSTPIAIFESRLGHEIDVTLPMDLGNLLQQPITKLYEMRLDRSVALCDPLVSKSKPYAMGEPDGAVLRRNEQSPLRLVLHEDFSHNEHVERLLEVKSTNWRLARFWGQPGTDQVPEDHACQVTWYMGITGVHLCDVAVLFDANRFEVYTVAFKQELFDGLYALAERFVTDHLKTGKPPDADWSERYGEYLARTFPNETSPSDLVPVSGLAIEEIVARWAKLKEAEKRLKLHKTLAANQIKAAIGSHTGLVSPGIGKLTWRQTKPTHKIDNAKALAEAEMMLGQLLDAMPDGDVRTEFKARLLALRPNNTREYAGFRRLHHSAKGSPLAEQIDKLTLTLDKLEAGDSLDEEGPFSE